MRKRYIVLIVVGFILAIILTRPKWVLEVNPQGTTSGGSPIIEHPAPPEGDEKSNGFDTSMRAEGANLDYDARKWSSWLKASQDLEL